MSTEPCLYRRYGHDLDSSLQPRRFVRIFIAFTPTLGPFSLIQMVSNMRPCMILAVLALAVSTASPALSAPAPYKYGNPLIEFKGQPS